MFFVERKFKAKLYRSKAGWFTLYVLARQDGLDLLKGRKWVIVATEVGGEELTFPANVCEKDRTYILTIPRWIRAVLREMGVKKESLELSVIIPSRSR